MELGEIIGYIASAAGGGGITALFNWRYNKKKNAESLKSDELENIRNSLGVYQTIIEDQNKRIRELTDEVNQLREDKRKMEVSYQHQLAAMQKQITELYRAMGIRANKQVRNELGQFVKTEEK